MNAVTVNAVTVSTEVVQQAQDKVNKRTRSLQFSKLLFVDAVTIRCVYNGDL